MHFKTCISPSAVARDKNDYWGYCHGIREPTTEAMRAGTERHRIYQSELQELKDIGGAAEFQNMLLDGKEIKLKEVPVCSRYYGLHGFLDVLSIQLKGDELFIRITELKSNWWKKYLFQIAAYGMMLEDPEFEVCWMEPYKKKEGERRLGMRLIPKNLSLKKNIKIDIFFFNSKKTLTFGWMENNVKTDFAAGMTSQVQKRLFEYRPLHKRSFILDEDIHPRRVDKQRFFGKAKLIIKSRPNLYHDPAYKI